LLSPTSKPHRHLWTLSHRQHPPVTHPHLMQVPHPRPHREPAFSPKIQRQKRLPITRESFLRLHGGSEFESVLATNPVHPPDGHFRRPPRCQVLRCQDSRQPPTH